jgi:hypothetical protein
MGPKKGQYVHHAGRLQPLVPGVNDRVEHGLPHKKVAHPLRNDDVDCPCTGKRPPQLLLTQTLVKPHTSQPNHQTPMRFPCTLPLHKTLHTPSTSSTHHRRMSSNAQFSQENHMKNHFPSRTLFRQSNVLNGPLNHFHNILHVVSSHQPPRMGSHIRSLNGVHFPSTRLSRPNG